MKEAYLTEDGQIHKNIQKVYLSDDETYYSKEYSDVSYYNKHKIKDITTILPDSFTHTVEDFFVFEFKYGQVDSLSNTISYDLIENKYGFDDDLTVSFDIQDNKITLKEISTWNRCSELFEDVTYMQELESFERTLL